MDSTLNCNDNSNNHLTRSEHADTTSNWWTQYRKPATYSEDHVGIMGHRLEPLRSINTGRTQDPTISAAEICPYPTTPIEPVEHPSPLATAPSSAYIELSYPVLQEYEDRLALPVTNTGGGPDQSVIMALEQIGSSKARSPTKASTAPKRSVESTPCHQNTALRKSICVTGNLNPTFDGATGVSSDSISNESAVVSSSNGRSNDYNAVQLPSTDDTISSSGSGRGSGSGSGSGSGTGGGSGSGTCNGSGTGSGAGKWPSIPRIVIPDGTSINLSTPPTTPPTTPHQEHSFIQANQVTPWPYAFQHIRERFLSRTRVAHFRSKQRSSNSHSKKDPVQRQTSSLTEQSPRPPAQENDNHPIELMEHAPLDDRDEQQQLQQQQSPIQITRDEESPSTEQLNQAHLPQFGIIGLPTGYRPESIESSEKYIWWDYDDETPGRFFSLERWKHQCCSRPGLIRTLKHVAATLLGLVMIVAIALTALGKIKNHTRVSDFIPDVLEDAIMEAQVAVIKDFYSLLGPKSNTNLNASVGDFTADDPVIEHIHQIKLMQATKIPIWTRPIPADCFNEECDIEDFGNEYFAFMHPESFGIALPHNWPALCNSCIEITRNQFLYRTRVRVLGDIISCSATPTTLTTAGSAITNEASSAPKASSLYQSQDYMKSTSLLTTIKTIATPLPTESPDGRKSRQKSFEHSRVYNQGSTELATKHWSHFTHTPQERRTQRLSTLKTRQTQHPQRHTYNHIVNQDLKSSHDSIKSAKSRIHKRQDSFNGLSGSNSESDAAGLPYLIVDSATFGNLTTYDTQEELANMAYLRLQFRFVLCDS